MRYHKNYTHSCSRFQESSKNRSNRPHLRRFCATGDRGETKLSPRKARRSPSSDLAGPTREVFGKMVSLSDSVAKTGLARKWILKEFIYESIGRAQPRGRQALGGDGQPRRRAICARMLCGELQRRLDVRRLQN